jgi:hypothetical protein
VVKVVPGQIRLRTDLFDDVPSGVWRRATVVRLG